MGTIDPDNLLGNPELTLDSATFKQIGTHAIGENGFSGLIALSWGS